MELIGKVLNNMLLIGSSGRNSGKTTLAKEIIANWKDDVPVYALKIISIDTLDGKCHRGETGCGVCTSLQTNYELVEEKSKQGVKDTAQLLAAGAKASYLLKTLRSHLAQSIEYFLKQIPPDAAIVCESNSLRHVVVPGVFLFVQNSRTGSMKPSAQGVYSLADKIVEQASPLVLQALQITKEENGTCTIGLQSGC